MEPKTNPYQQIEDYCRGSLEQDAQREFETALKRNQDLKKEFEMEREIQDAISEKDVLNLRNKLQSIVSPPKQKNKHFDLLEGFENIKPLTQIVPPEELLKFYDSLPKAHVYQHELFDNENIHEFFREQNDAGMHDHSREAEMVDPDFEEELEGLEEAVLEKDILKLRDNLSKVSQSCRETFSAEEIDRYLNHELDDHEMEQFNQELIANSVLRQEVHLHHELEKALLEIDVMNLKDGLNRVMETETSYGVSEKQIEDYIDGTLEGRQLAAFQSELKTNPGLRSELALRKKAEEAIGEKDMMALRYKLNGVKRDVNTRESKSIVPDKKIRQIHWWRAGVAVAIILFAFAGFFSKTWYSWEDYYQSPQWSPQRSVQANAGILQQANSYFVKAEYDKAVSLYDKAILDNQGEKFVFHFYKAASLQNMGKYKEAVNEYSQVIDHGNNMFVEEAEWYKALCTLKLGEKNSAKKQLQAIIRENGFYVNDAKAVLKRNRFSF